MSLGKSSVKNMKRVKLTQNKYAIVDDGDFRRLSIHKWVAHQCQKGHWYASTSLKFDGKYRTIYMHRYILGLNIGDFRKTDHINHSTLDNRRENIRKCTSSQNNRNRIPRKGSSIYKGVCWDKYHKKWQSRIRINRKTIVLGYFDLEKEAASTYNEAAKKHYREFACLNKVQK